MTLLALPVDTAPSAADVAAVRTRVTVPLRFPDGYATTADVFTFTGLADGKEHLPLGLGDWRRALERSAAGGDARWSGRTASASPATSSAPSAATAGRSCARRPSGSPTPAASCSTCARRAAASACTPSSTRTPCRTPGLDTYEANLALGPRRGRARLHGRRPDAARRSASTAIRLLSNNPDKAAQLDVLGITVTEQVPHRRAPVRGQRPVPDGQARPHRAHSSTCPSPADPDPTTPRRSPHGTHHRPRRHRLRR